MGALYFRLLQSVIAKFFNALIVITRDISYILSKVGIVQTCNSLPVPSIRSFLALLMLPFPLVKIIVGLGMIGSRTPFGFDCFTVYHFFLFL